MATTTILTLYAANNFSDNAATKTNPARKRRRRAVLSCLRCRRLKVECNRQSPCSRCVWSHNASSCVYQAPPEAPAKRTSKGKPSSCSKISPEAFKFSVPPSLKVRRPDCKEFMGHLDKHSLLAAISLSAAEHSGCVTGIMCGHLDPNIVPKYRGRTYSRNLLGQFKSVLPGIEESIALETQYTLRNSRTAICTTLCFEKGPGSDNSCGTPMSKAQIIQAYLPNRNICELLINSYLSTLENTYRLFHIPTFKGEVSTFWQDPSACDIAWLGQLLMVLALGYKVSNIRTERLPADPSKHSTFEKFLTATKLCFKATLASCGISSCTVRSLCLMTIAKRITAFSCHEIDACSFLMDIAVLISRWIGLDRPLKTDSPRAAFEEYLRSRLWTTVMFLKIQQAMNNGTVPNLQKEDFDTLPTANINDFEISQVSTSTPRVHGEQEYTNSSSQILLAKALPIAWKVVSQVNGQFEPTATANDVRDYDYALRNLLIELDGIYLQTAQEDCQSSMYLERSTLEIFFRRLQVHNDQLFESLDVCSAARCGPDFRSASLECALAILVHQRSMLEYPEASSDQVYIVAELFKKDFVVATLFICAKCYASDRVYLAQDLVENGTAALQGSAKQTIMQTLRWCWEIWARDAERSLCNFWSYVYIRKITETISCRD